ncbi:MAG: 16S rRNA (guanine(527)-N(7))-methyltransferase RsmG [Bacillus sp. (in: Bacteria)]|nr:16S rRNA (guanine(527)-N(7))-methyltransferase RsmG [Bacillus sp. (in: firmicutes)]MCM1425357.1 16S rRNA (guanine(527)-N(7))-methyltransferase RsmG [Eubacterium sp.]
MENYKLNSFYEDLKDLSVSLNEEQIRQFMKYYELLVEWNQVMNLTTITDFDEVCKKHFIDSLSFVKAYDISTVKTLIDIGTGAGFPGIPLKIAFPHLKVTLLDSLNKRVNFLNTIIKELSLKDIEAIHGRAEDFAGKGKLREQYDMCVSRAVANLSTLCEYCIPYVKTGGHFISYKSEKITEEMKNAGKAISVLGGRLENQVEFMIPHSDYYRNLVVISKIKKTPASYPRKAGVPTKTPIM